MRKLVFSFLMLASGSFVFAQKYDAIKTDLTLGKADKAKEALDKKMTDPKFTSKAEAYMLKAAIYSQLAADSAVQNTPQGDQLLSEAEVAFAKYREMDPAGSLMEDPIYKNGPVNIYSTIFRKGYEQYEKKDFAASSATFNKVLALSDFLAAHKILTSPIDTNSLILAAYTAEQAKNRDDAAKHYARLADAKVSGNDFENVYRYLVIYHFEKKNMADFEKYKELGRALYPNSEFFSYDKTDFAISLEDDFNKKLADIDAVLADDPNNFKGHLAKGQIIFDTLYGKGSEAGNKPANAAELETKMIAAFDKASLANPDTTLPYLYLGDMYIKKSEAITNKKSPEYLKAMEMAAVPYEKAAVIYGKKSSLTAIEKQQYKNIAGYLGDIYTLKAEAAAKTKPADKTKFEAVARKWNDLYAGIR